MDSYPAPEPLCLSALEPGTHIEVRDEHGNRLYHGHVKEVTDDREPMVVLHDETHHRDTSMFAADMGLKPYASGRWTSQQRTYDFATRRVSDIPRPDRAIPREPVRA